jgi:hypothetical protein
MAFAACRILVWFTSQKYAFSYWCQWLSYPNRSDLGLTHEFQPRAGSLPTPSGSSRPSTAGNAASKKAPVRDMLGEAKGKTSICFYTRRFGVHFVVSCTGSRSILCTKNQTQWHVCRQCPSIDIIGSTCALLLLVSGEGAIIQCFACYPARLVLKHEQNAITVSAKQRRKSLPVLTTPLV